MSVYGARYSRFLYGTELYGAIASTSNILWAIQVDWDGDGLFDGSNEAPYATGMTTRRGRSNLLDESGKGFQSVAVGRLMLEFDNSDGRYDARNASSPLYPNILPGRLIKITATLNGVTYPIFFGSISDIQPVGRRHERVRMEAEDGVRWLREHSTNTATQINVPVDEAMALVLAGAEWPLQWGSSLNNSPDYINNWWTEVDTPAWNALQDLADFSFGTIFVAADGSFKFIMRQNQTTPSVTISEDIILKDILLPQPWENIRNVIDVVVQPLDPQTASPLWSLQNPVKIAVGETITVFGSYTSGNVNVAAQSVSPLVAGTDYKLVLNADGGGTDFTSSCVVTSAAYSTQVIFTVTNNSASAAYLTILQIRGIPLVPAEPSTLRIIDTASKAIYGAKTFRIDSMLMQQQRLAQMVSGEISTFFSSPADTPTIQLEARDSDQLSLDLFDRITFNSPTLNINSNFAIGYIEHTWLSENGQAIRTTLILEPYYYQSGSFWQFPTQIGTTSYFAP